MLPLLENVFVVGGIVVVVVCVVVIFICHSYGIDMQTFIYLFLFFLLQKYADNSHQQQPTYVRLRVEIKYLLTCLLYFSFVLRLLLLQTVAVYTVNTNTDRHCFYARQF